MRQDEVPWEDDRQGELFARRRRRLALAGGGRQIGCSLIELAPGKTAWPFHYHLGNEEAVYVLTGEATLRIGSERIRVQAGDYIALPIGPDHAHQLTNTSDAPVRYLVISTMHDPDVVVYPDSDKIGAIAGAAPGAVGPRDVFAFFPRAAAVDYWHDEPTGSPGIDAATAPGSDPAQKQAAFDRAAAEAERERRIDDEIAQLKQKLGMPGERGAKSGSPEDELDALKRKLDES